MNLIRVTVGDIRLCPITESAGADCLEFWDRWRGKVLLVGTPIASEKCPPYYSHTVVCNTDLYWPVYGPPEFLSAFAQARFGDELLDGEITRRMLICRHLIVGD